MKLSDLKAWDDVLEEALDDDPALRRDWEDSALLRGFLKSWFGFCAGGGFP